MPTRTLYRAALCVVLAALASCGGSGGDSGSTTSSTDGAPSAGATSVVALSSATYTAPAASASAIVMVNRSGASSGEAVVEYTTVNETAVAGTDYTQTSGELTWAEGDTAPKAISVPVTAAGIGKEFAVTLVSITGAADFGMPTSATVVISGASDAGSSNSSSSSSSSGSSSTSSSSSASTASAASPSASGTMIPSATRVVDDGLNVWTVGGGVIYENSATAGYSANVVLLLYFNAAIYQENSACNWWRWTSGAWQATTKPPVATIPACPAGSSSKSSSSSSKSTSSSSGSSAGSGSSSSRSSSGTTSSSGSSSSNGSSAPPVAAAVGYNTVTFGPNPRLGTNLFAWEFLGPESEPAGYASQNADGSLAISGNESSHYGASVSAVQLTSSRTRWSGLAFGGGAYFEAVLSFTGQSDYYYPNGGPAFWLKDVEQFSQGQYAVNWPSGSTPAWSASTRYAAGDMVGYGGQIWVSKDSGNIKNTPPSPGQPANAYWTGYNDFYEIDVMEYDSANAKFPNTYQVNFANWYGSPTTGSGPSKNWPEAVPGAMGSISVPSGTDFSQPHKYGFLWVPATGSGQTTFTQGYAKAYFDGVQVGQTAFWNYYDPNQPENYPAPPPVVGTTSMSGMDWRHLVPILGSDPQHPMTVHSITVWQASGADNITQ
jgi:hypothetical protein